jgi:hypothetical protein
MFHKVEYNDVLDTFLRLMHSLLSCRILLNLRGAKEASASQDMQSIITAGGASHVVREPITFARSIEETRATTAWEGEVIELTALPLESDKHPTGVEYDLVI